MARAERAVSSSSNTMRSATLSRSGRRVLELRIPKLSGTRSRATRASRRGRACGSDDLGHGVSHRAGVDRRAPRRREAPRRVRQGTPALPPRARFGISLVGTHSGRSFPRRPRLTFGRSFPHAHDSSSRASARTTSTRSWRARRPPRARLAAPGRSSRSTGTRAASGSESTRLGMRSCATARLPATPTRATRRTCRTSARFPGTERVPRSRTSAA
jgi:hypothetical protein